MKNSALASLVALLCGLALARTQGATFTATNTDDSGSGSLRQAILDANAASGDDVITFTGTGTITLASVLPAITDNTTITGPGTNLLTISGNNTVRAFTLSAGTTNTISGLTIANGRATNYANGAGIANTGRLTILNCALVNNQNFGGWGGAVFNSGHLAIFNSTFSGNQVTGENGSGSTRSLGGARTGGGGGSAGLGGGLCSLSGIVGITGCTFAGNSATGGNGGEVAIATYGGVPLGNGRGGGINGGTSGNSQWSSAGSPGGAGGFAGGGGGGGCGIAAGGGGQGGFGGGSGGIGDGTFNSSSGGQGGSGVGGGIFVDTGTVTILESAFAGNQAVGGLGGSGLGPDFFTRAGTVLPELTTTTLGGGSVNADPANAPYPTNALAVVTATPTPGWNFLKWLGDASGTNPVINVSVTRNKYVQAVFGTQLTGSALMSLNPQSDLYPYGTIVKLTALPPGGTYFTSWSGDASGTNNPLSFIVTNPNQSVSYLLGALSAGQFALTVIENGRGHVGFSPLASYYATNQTVTLTAMPDPGQDFIGWSGDATGTQNPLLVSMVQSKVITATFTKRPSLRVGTPLEGLTGDGFRLSLLGEFGGSYGIVGSTNLQDWNSVGTVTNTYGTVQITDVAATNLPHRFYRATLQ